MLVSLSSIVISMCWDTLNAPRFYLEGFIWTDSEALFVLVEFVGLLELAGLTDWVLVGAGWVACDWVLVGTGCVCVGCVWVVGAGCVGAGWAGCIWVVGAGLCWCWLSRLCLCYLSLSSWRCWLRLRCCRWGLSVCSLRLRIWWGLWVSIWWRIFFSMWLGSPCFVKVNCSCFSCGVVAIFEVQMNKQQSFGRL